MAGPRSVVLSGFMGTGKSTVGPLLAARLGLPFVDTDAEIERSAGSSIAALWSREGEAAFRQREARVVENALVGEARVVAFGGGVVASPRLRRLAVDRALVATLTAAPEAILARAGDVRSRPALEGAEGPMARALQLLALRAEAYAEAHLTVATDSLGPDAVADALVDLVRRDPLLVPLGGRSYCIDVCVGEPARLARAVGGCRASSVVVVTDAHVHAARHAALVQGLRDLDVAVTEVVLTPGEANKTLGSVGRIWDAALAARVNRDALVVAFGGGVVGDLAGFAAACLLRGIRFVQVPTTLLAMVDSSVGGKTGFDHAAGKNLIGAFHQPSAVVVDLDHLSTLNARERAAGLAEIVKIALATDASLLAKVEERAAALAQGDVEALLPIVRLAIDAKIRVVRDDERESGPRALLNLGHTVGHALEAHGGFSRWLHGEAVALGTVAEMRATASLGWTPPDLVTRAEDLFARLGLATRAEAAAVADAWPYVSSDKKMRGRGALGLPVVTAAGCAEVRQVELTELRAALGASR